MRQAPCASHSAYALNLVALGLSCRSLVSLYEAVAADLTKFIQDVRSEWHKRVARSSVMQQLACSLLKRRNVLDIAFTSQLRASGLWVCEGT